MHSEWVKITYTQAIKSKDQSRRSEVEVFPDTNATFLEALGKTLPSMP